MNKKQEKLRWLADQPWIENFFHIQIMDTIHLLGWIDNKMVSSFTDSGAIFTWDVTMKWLRGEYYVDIHNNPDEKTKIIFTFTIR